MRITKPEILLIVARYSIYLIIAIETILLPTLIAPSKYAEIEFLKYTALLGQFILTGACTGYIRHLYFPKLKLSPNAFLTCSTLHCMLIAVALFPFLGTVEIIIIAFTSLATVTEAILRGREDYMKALSFKPILSLSIITLAIIGAFNHTEAEKIILFATTLAAGSIALFALPHFSDKQGYVGVLHTIKLYVASITYGFYTNIATALTFLLFYQHRIHIKESSFEVLHVYSLSFALTQAANLAVTTIAYRRINDFGKLQGKVSEELKLAKATVAVGLILFIAAAAIVISFSYFAEQYYQYENLFECTAIMMVLQGLGNVANSVNAIHLYSGKMRLICIAMLGTTLTSIYLSSEIKITSEASFLLSVFCNSSLYLGFSLFSLYFAFKTLWKKS